MLLWVVSLVRPIEDYISVRFGPFISTSVFLGAYPPLAQPDSFWIQASTWPWDFVTNDWPYNPACSLIKPARDSQNRKGTQERTYPETQNTVDLPSTYNHSHEAFMLGERPFGSFPKSTLICRALMRRTPTTDPFKGASKPPERTPIFRSFTAIYVLGTLRV